MSKGIFKKILITFLAALFSVMCVIGLTACKSKSFDTFTTDYFVDKENLFFVDSYSADGVYYLPDNPTKDGYVFDGWVDEDGQPWDGEYPQSADEQLILYARWLKEEHR